MGWNTVAVILNDQIDRFDKDGPLGKRLAQASRSYQAVAAGYGAPLDCDFGAGQIISHAHADGYQVTVTHGNMGWRVDNPEMDKYPGWHAFDQMKECLERNGFKVTKRRKLTSGA